MKQDYFSILDIFIALIWLIILSVVVNNRASKIENSEIKGYYNFNFYVKVVSGIIFTLFYIFYYGGGDTIAYWDGAVVLNKLFYKSPTVFLQALFSDPTAENRMIFFNMDTGLPPRWIYQETEGWFVSKIASIISLFSFRSLPAAVIIFAFFVSNATWQVFELVSKLNLHTVKVAARCMLFVPSVGFWCSGITKDTLIYISILNILFFTLDILILKSKITLIHVISILFYLFIISNIRSFALAATLAPLLVAFGTRITNKYGSSTFAKIGFRTLFIGAGVGFFLTFFSSSYVTKLAEEASVVQNDFKNNTTYTGKKYDIGNIDGTPLGMIQAFPISVFYGVYKPLIYESFSPTLILNGLESSILVVMTLLFLFNGNVFKKIARIRSNEFLVFALVFTILIGFMAGYTSVLYGVLVRIRAPLLPFLFLIFTTKPEEIKKPEDNLLTENK